MPASTKGSALQALQILRQCAQRPGSGSGRGAQAAVGGLQGKGGSVAGQLQLLGGQRDGLLDLQHGRFLAAAGDVLVEGLQRRALTLVVVQLARESAEFPVQRFDLLALLFLRAAFLLARRCGC